MLILTIVSPGFFGGFGWLVLFLFFNVLFLQYVSVSVEDVILAQTGVIWKETTSTKKMP